MKNFYSKQVAVVCPICGARFIGPDTKTEELSDDDEVQCQDCKSVFTITELMEYNSANIDAEQKALLERAVDDVINKVLKSFK